MARRNLPNQNIDEVWIYEKGEIRLFYKDGKFYYYTKGCSDRFIRRAIMARRNLPNQNIDEVWIYEKGEIRLFYKDGKFYY